MPTISELKGQKGGGRPLLKGSDVPKGVSKIKIKVSELRLAPENFSSLAIIDLETPVYDKESWAVNITNCKLLGEFCSLEEDFDMDDLAAKLKGRTITLEKNLVNNPQTKRPTRSLAIVGVSKK